MSFTTDAEGAVPNKTFAADTISGVEHVRMKVEHGETGQAVDASATNPLPVRAPKVASAAVTQVPDVSGSAVTLAGPNAGRAGLIIVNDSPAVLYVKYGAAASPTSYTWRLAPYGTVEMADPIYTGLVSGTWASDAGGFAYVTEL